MTAPTTETASPTGETDPATGPDEPVEPAGTTVPTEDAETFPRAYVEQLRQESAGYRTRAQRADALADRLMTATVREAVAGILADSSDLDVTQMGNVLDDDGFPDAGKIAEAARELVSRKPHLADRRPRGDVDQGARTTSADVDLAGLLRSRT